MNDTTPQIDEILRLADDERRLPGSNWKRWGPYLAERQWGTVREDYSPDGTCWDYFPHDHARSRAYRWGEDGLLGITDRECRLCFALALWNERDPILKERLFGLNGHEGNHGEDVKECYYYLDSTPTHSYMRALYKYPQAEFPYAWLLEENRRRNRDDAEFELNDTGVFDDHRYFDVTAEYAKESPDNIFIRIKVANRGPATARLHLLPTIWFRNTWSWGCEHEGCWPKPSIRVEDDRTLTAYHATLGHFGFTAGSAQDGSSPEWLFTENETNFQRVFGIENGGGFAKDAFHEYLIDGNKQAINPQQIGTKAAAHYVLELPAGITETIKLRLFATEDGQSQAAETKADKKRRSGGNSRPAKIAAIGDEFDETFAQREAEADEFYQHTLEGELTDSERTVMRQANAGLLWTKQFYHYIVKDWIGGDPEQPEVSASRQHGRNHDWPHLFSRDVLSMPDKWEYPWFAAWDSAFHMIPFAHLDPHFTKEQLVLFLREWYMHPNGQIPAYEFAFGDVNPPVHAWACWRVYKMTGPRGNRDRVFLARVFQKLVLNFTWWVNRKDVRGKHLFSGGFLGLDNIGLFDRSKPLPTGGHLEQADGTAWMAFFCSTMLAMALELAVDDPAYGDMASKFFEHFIEIVDAMNTLDGSGLWDELDGFYYDHLLLEGQSIPLRVRSMVGIIPLFAVEVLDERVIEQLPGFSKRLHWFLENRQDLARHIAYLDRHCPAGTTFGHRLLAIPSRERLERMLQYILDEREFFSPYGIRSLSQIHRERPFHFSLGGENHCVEYIPGDSTTGIFGGNSNWRGPIWFPLNYLLIESLERYHHFYGDDFQVECPTGSGRMMNLREVAHEIEARLLRLFLPDADGRRPCHGDETRYADDPHWRDLVLFYEFFHGDNGAGHGASHQTGWTALAARLLKRVGKRSTVSGGV